MFQDESINLDVRRLSVMFQTSRRTVAAVENMSFDLQRGKTLALLGESGCGKSLTSLALMRLGPSQSVYGRKSAIFLKSLSKNQGALDLLDLPEAMMQTIRGKRLAMIFQEPMTALNPVLSIGEQLAEAVLKNQTLQHGQLQQRLLTLLQEVEMPDPQRRLRQYPHQLSGGQKQRVMIAMALAGNPEVLIADEPTTALDVTIQAQILTLLKKLQIQHQMSILLITHDLGVVKAMADQVCVMYAGQMVEMSSTQAFFQGPSHPYAQQLLCAIPSLTNRAHQLPVIQGQVPAPGHFPSGCRFHPRCAHAFGPCSRRMPRLQTLPSMQKIRCHLYPGHTQLPPLQHTLKEWPSTQDAAKVILAVKNLTIHFPAPGTLRGHSVFKAVEDLSFDLYQGQTLALVGESGCGKTTVCRALLRLQAITSGQMLYRDQSIDHLRWHAYRHYRKKVQIIFQDPYSSMNPRMTISEILNEGLQLQRLSKKEKKTKKTAFVGFSQFASW